MLLASTSSPSLHHGDPALEAARGVHQLRRRARVQAQAVHDLRLALDHLFRLRLRPRLERRGICALAGCDQIPRQADALLPLGLEPRARSADRRSSPPAWQARRSTIGRLTPVSTSTLPGLEEGHGDVAGRAAVHVGQDQHSLAPRPAAPGPRRTWARASSKPSLQSSDSASNAGELAGDHVRGRQELPRQPAVRQDQFADHL